MVRASHIKLSYSICTGLAGNPTAFLSRAIAQHHQEDCSPLPASLEVHFISFILRHLLS